MVQSLPSPDIITLPANNNSTKAASTSFVTAAVAAALATLQGRVDIASYKKAINAWQANGVDAMYAYSCTSMGAPATIAFFVGSDVPGGDFETLVLQPWLTGLASPATGAAGQGQTTAQATATIALLRLNVAIIQAAGPSPTLTPATFAKVASTGAYSDLSGLPVASDIIAAGMAAWAKTLPIADPGVPGAPWLNGGTLAFSQ